VARLCGGSDSDGLLDRERIQRVSRRALARRGALGIATLGIGGVLALDRRADAQTAPSRRLDEKIFNFALLLEYVQAAFYAEAVKNGSLRDDVRDFAVTVAEHERQHVEYLRKALGSKARQRPDLEFGDATRDRQKFLDTAVMLENLGVSAYNGQAANLTKPALAAAAEIVSVEGRHAAWVNDLAGREPAPHAADVGMSATDVAAQLRSTKFIRS
jgi:rubrerythrin